MFLAPLALVAGATVAPPLDDCAKRDSLELDAKLAADLRTTYDVAGTGLRVCVDSAMYPYAAGRGHRFYTCFKVGFGSDTARFCGGGAAYTDWHGYRVTVSLRTPRFTSSSDVWLEVEPAPKKK